MVDETGANPEYCEYSELCESVAKLRFGSGRLGDRLGVE